MNQDYGIYPDHSTDFSPKPETPVMDKNGLTVGKLISALQKFPIETPVCVSGRDQRGVSRITGVSDNHRYGNDNDGAIIDFDLED